MARDLIQEIESFIPAFSRRCVITDHLFTNANCILGSRSGSQSSGSSGSSVMSLRRNRAPSRPTEEIDYPTTDDDDVSGSEDEEEGHDPDAEAVQEAIDTPQPLVQLLRPQTAPTQRSHSSLSSRYRTPGPQASSSFATPGPFLPTQPQMGYAAPSAFSASPPPSRTRPLSLDPAPTHPAWDRSSARAFSPVMPLAQRPLGPVYDTPSGARTSPLEGAVQALQAHMAAMQERIDILEHMLLSRAGPGASPALSPPWVGSRNLDHDTNSRRSVIFDANDLGLWSLVARPTSALVKLFVFILRVILSPRLASSQPPSPILLILRRLALDASFVLMALWAAKRGWRASGARRKDVRAALGMLVHAVIGSERTPRQLADKGV
jgi:hypothetical protein